MQTQNDVLAPDGTEALGTDPAPTRNGAAPGLVGGRVREERLRQKIGVRELARRVGVSASLISQVELGKASPSVGTLYAITNELGLSLDQLFFQSDGPPHPNNSETELEPRSAERQVTPAVVDTPRSFPGRVPPVVHQHDAKVIQLASGVRWIRLTPETPQDVDFLEVTYGVGSESCPPDSLMRHSGHEYGHMLEGRMGVTIGFDTYELGPGDSVAFDSTMPHRLFTIGDTPARAIWVVIGRRGDPRLGPV